MTKGLFKCWFRDGFTPTVTASDKEAARRKAESLVGESPEGANLPPELGCQRVTVSHVERVDAAIFRRFG